MPVSSDVGKTYHILRKVQLDPGQLLEISGAIYYTRPAYDKGISGIYQGVVSASWSVCGYCWTYLAVPSVFQMWSESTTHINVLAGGSIILFRQSS